VHSNKKSDRYFEKAMALNDNIPGSVQPTTDKSWISTLITKVRLLDLYIHLDVIPDDKVGSRLISEINKEIAPFTTTNDKLY
jgi:hypothetical protein